MEVEKVSNDVMMMWHGTHCGSLRTYFADKYIFETAPDLERKSASTSPGPRRRGRSFQASIRVALRRLRDWSPPVSGPLVRPGMVDGIYAIPVPMTTPPKSRKRPGPPSRGGRGILIGLRLQKDDYKAAVDWGKREDVATLPEAIRQLMRLGLAASRSGKKSP